MKKIINIIIKFPIFIYYFIKYRLLNLLIKNKNYKKKFDLIYKTNYWKSGIDGSRSGYGSNLENTKNIRIELQKFIDEQNIKTILDIPCGDFYWMSKMNLENTNYIGGDIVEDIIKDNIKKYQKNNITFKTIDFIKDQLPSTDLIFSRDCLVHLNDDEILNCINNVRKSKSKYFASTIFVKDYSNKESNLSDNWRPINLLEHPFNLPEPIKILNDSTDFQNFKKIAIWEISSI